MKHSTPPTYSIEDYFHLVEEASEKYEYISGEVKMMAGGTADHSIISTNVIYNLKNQLKGRNYRVFNSDIQLAAYSNKYTSASYFYPDAMVICGETEFEGKGKNRVKNPVLVIEVLSKSTTNYDQNDKFRYYAEIPSLKEYILIDSERINVRGFYKVEDDIWKISNAYKIEQHISVYSLDIQLSLQALYEATFDVKK